MISRIKKVTNWAFYPWILTLYPIIYLYSVNLGDVREDDVIEVVLAAFMATTIIYTILYLLIRNQHKVGAITGIISLVFLTYGHIYNAIGDTGLGQKLLMPGMIIIAFMAIFLILHSKVFWRQLTPYLNMIFAVLMLMALWPIIDFQVINPPSNATALANPLERVVSTPTVNNSPERPDIYYIILDGYSSNDFWLREYGYDNSDFTDALEERGFYVAYDSLSNYGVTLVSLPSSLNMRYITNDDRDSSRQNNIPDTLYLRSLVANNRVADELKSLGYTYLYMLSGHLSPSVMADQNIAFYPTGTKYFSGDEFLLSGGDGSWAFKQPFWAFFLDTTMLCHEKSRFNFESGNQPHGIYAPEMVFASFEELKRISAMEEATFSFTHILVPHEPIRFDREGNFISIDIDDPEKEYYFFEELHYINTRVLELVDYILSESSVPPIIIIQADHGTRLGSPFGEDLQWSNFEILNAYYLPDDGAEVLYPEISPVNSFRVILNYYFDGDYELLESRQYLIPNGMSKDDFFTHIRYMDDDRLNVGWGDHIALIYFGIDDNGKPEFFVHGLSDTGEKGDLLLTITYDLIEPYLDTPPEQNTLIAHQDQVVFYALTSGEVQFNIGPDSDGHEWAIVLDLFPTRVVNGYEVGAN